jgi:uncharacterized protein HemY
VVLGQVALSAGEPAAARTFLEEALALRREIGARPGIASTLTELGHTELAAGDLAAAKARYAAALVLWRLMTVR